jgi:UDP-glucose 4-epimerase
MKILITGGCGFVGANLIFHLQELGGHEIVVLDNESLGKRSHIEGADVHFLHGDICDEQMLLRALEGADAVVHLAADTRVMDSIADPRKNFEVNVQGTFNLLSAMREQGVTRIVNASTGGAIIGEADPPVHERMMPAPIAPYGASKLAVEGYLSAFAGAYGFHAVSLRFSNVYGPRSFHKGSVVAEFLRRVMAGEPLTVFGDGEQTRDYVFAADLCDGITRALTSDVNGVYQLGTGRGTSINALIDTIRDVVGPDFPVEVDYQDSRAGEIKHTWCDISKARDGLGYAPETVLGDGLAETWSWFLNQR